MSEEVIKIDDRVKKCQVYLLGLLKYLHNICVENNIKYTLEAGTMLGAIRHKGFIPWDDDCDVSLVREEYDKLINILKKTSLPSNIGVYFPDEKKEFLDFNVRLFDKSVVIRDDEKSLKQYDGIFSHPTLDVYVMDHMPRVYMKRRLFVLWQQIAFGLAMSKRNTIHIEKYKPVEKIGIAFLSKLGKLFSLKDIMAYHDNVSKKYLNKDVECFYCTGWAPEFPGWVFEKKSYEKYHLTDFEGTKLYITDDYETLLDGYGDWRTPKKTHDHMTFIESL